MKDCNCSAGHTCTCYSGKIPFPTELFAQQLLSFVSRCSCPSSPYSTALFTKKSDPRPILFLCIGSDRICGDCLGPLVGYKLEQGLSAFPNYINVCGSLSHPVHAVNLRQHLHQLRRTKALIIAIDASIGTRKDLGMLCLTPSALYPGEGVSKRLPAVGEISITGVTAYEENPVPFHQQNVPLSFVMEMADRIYQGLITFLKLYTLQERPLRKDPDSADRRW